MLHIPLGGWSKDKNANRLALILLFATTDDSALFKTVAEKRYSIRKNTTESGENNKLIAKPQKNDKWLYSFLMTHKVMRSWHYIPSWMVTCLQICWHHWHMPPVTCDYPCFGFISFRLLGHVEHLTIRFK